MVLPAVSLVEDESRKQVCCRFETNGVFYAELEWGGEGRGGNREIGGCFVSPFILGFICDIITPQIKLIPT